MNDFSFSFYPGRWLFHKNLWVKKPTIESFRKLTANSAGGTQVFNYSLNNRFFTTLFFFNF